MPDTCSLTTPPTVLDGPIIFYGARIIICEVSTRSASPHEVTLDPKYEFERVTFEAPTSQIFFEEETLPSMTTVI